jgi:hypothetical protein
MIAPSPPRPRYGSLASGDLRHSNPRRVLTLRTLDIALLRSEVQSIPAIKIGDFVKVREDRPAASPRHVGMVGQIVKADHTPQDSSKVYIRYNNGEEFWIDPGALSIVRSLEDQS